VLVDFVLRRRDQGVEFAVVFLELCEKWDRHLFCSRIEKFSELIETWYGLARFEAFPVKSCHYAPIFLENLRKAGHWDRRDLALNFSNQVIKGSDFCGLRDTHALRGAKLRLCNGHLIVE
jgi:hypothetical protein